MPSPPTTSVGTPRAFDVIRATLHEQEIPPRDRCAGRRRPCCRWRGDAGHRRGPLSLLRQRQGVAGFRSRFFDTVAVIGRSRASRLRLEERVGFAKTMIEGLTLLT